MYLSQEPQEAEERKAIMDRAVTTHLASGSHSHPHQRNCYETQQNS